MIPESIVAGQVLAPIISFVTAIVLYHYIGRDYLGAEENMYWNALRVYLLSEGDSIVRQKTNFALTNTPSDEEFVASVDVTSHEVALALEEAGYLQCVLSGLKMRGDEFEDGSMVYRESKSDLVPDVFALRQTHVYWFDDGEGIDIYAHEEYSSLNPLVAWKHYRAVTQNPQKGKEIVSRHLDML